MLSQPGGKRFPPLLEIEIGLLLDRGGNIEQAHPIILKLFIEFLPRPIECRQ